MENGQFQELVLGHLVKLSQEMTEVKTDIAGIKTELNIVKTDIAGIKAELNIVKTDITGIKAELAGVKSEILALKQSQTRFETKLNTVVEQTAGLIE